MGLIGECARRIWYLLNRRQHAAELAREMAAHRAMMDDPRRFGSSLRLREEAADAWGWRWLDDLWHDVRYGLRQLRRMPAFTALAVLTLGAGLGANTAMFGVVNAYLFGELPVPRPSQLRSIAWTVSLASGRDADSRSLARGSGVPREAFAAFRNSTTAFSSVACATDSTLANVGLRGRPERVTLQRVSGDYFRTFGVEPRRGRLLLPDDDRPGAPPAIVLSDRAWQRLFGGNTDVIGELVAIESVAAVVVGVLPPEFRTSTSASVPDVTMTLAGGHAAAQREGRAIGFDCRVIARLNDGAPPERARQESELALRAGILEAVAQSRGWPAANLRLTVRLEGVGRGIDELGARELQREAASVTAVTVLLAAIVLIPCANIAGMLLARAASRRREIATRLGLGASRPRIIRQLLTEGLLLSLLAGAVGLALASGLGRLASTVSRQALLFDGRLMAAVTALCFVTTVVFALTPALNATRFDLATSFKDASAGLAGSTRSLGTSILIAVQVVLSVLLLVGAGLQVRTLIASMKPLTHDPERVVTFQADPGRGRDVASYARDALARVLAIPGVAAASASGFVWNGATTCRPDGASTGPVHVNHVAPGLFHTMHIPLRRGRDLEWNDVTNASEVAVVNESLARQLYGQQDPLGKPLAGANCLFSSVVIVGVVANSRNAVAEGFQGGNGVSPTVYLPLTTSQTSLTELSIAARTSTQATQVVPFVRNVMRDLDPTVPVDRIGTQADQLRQYLRQMRTISTVLIAIGLLAILQAGFGVYGTVSRFVNRRTAEIGVRIAMGASRSDVVLLVMRQSLVPVIVGLVLSLVVSPAALAVLASAGVMSGAEWRDQLIVVIAASTLMVFACAAAALPAWRAARLDSSAALRAE
jgi:predicted permease